MALTQPAPGQVVAGTQALAADVGSAADVAEVSFYVDGELVGAADAAPFSFGWDTTVWSAGEHRLRAVAATTAGVAASTDEVVVTVEQPPVEPTDPGLAEMLDDLDAGTLSAEEFARYAVGRSADPTAVPQQYQSSGSPEQAAAGASAAFSAALGLVDALSPAARDELISPYLPGEVPYSAPVPLTASQVEADFGYYRLGSDPDEPEQVAPASEESAALLRSTEGAVRSGVLPDPALHGKARGTVHCGADEDTMRPLLFPDLVEGVALTCRYATPDADFFYVPDDVNDEHGVDASLDVWDTHLTDAFGGNGVPDEIDTIAESYYEALAAYRELGYPTVPHTRVGIVAPDALTGVSYPEIATIYLPRTDTAGDFATQAYVIRHELFHQVQYQYRYPYSWQRIAADYLGVANWTLGWWMEATAEWAAHKAQEWTAGWLTADATPFRRAAVQTPYDDHLADLLGEPAGALTRFVAPVHGTDNQPQYGAFVLAEYLEEELGASAIRQTWDMVDQDTTPIEAIVRFLEQHDRSPAEFVSGFHRANLSVATAYSDPDARRWAERLDSLGGGPRHETSQVSPTLSASGSGVVAPGGALYLKAADVTSVAALTSIRLVASGDGADRMAARAVRIDAQGQPCQGPEGDGFALTGADSRLWGVVPVTAECPSLAIIVSNTDPTGGSATDGTGRFQVHYEVGYREAGDGPLDVGLVIDRSLDPSTDGAMIARQRAAAHALLDTLEPGDRVTVFGYDSGANWVLPALTSDFADVHTAIDEAYDSMTGWSYPNLGDALGSVVDVLAAPGALDPARGRLIVAFGDGGGWSSPPDSAEATMIRLGIPVYMVGWDPLYAPEQPERIAERTGGIFTRVGVGQTPDSELDTLLTWRRWVVSS